MPCGTGWGTQCLGVPIAGHKTEGPAKCLTFLGIELDSEAMEVRLPEFPLGTRATVPPHGNLPLEPLQLVLLSLVDQLQHACCVVKPGRTFLRRMIKLASSVRELHYRV